jgi:hypothetical protein
MSRNRDRMVSTLLEGSRTRLQNDPALICRACGGYKPHDVRVKLGQICEECAQPKRCIECGAEKAYDQSLQETGICNLCRFEEAMRDGRRDERLSTDIKEGKESHSSPR